MATQSAERLHALDAVRGGALLLGIVVHLSMSFWPIPFWPIRDNAPSSELLTMFGVLHIFRMSLFFVIAGFFARLVLEKRGARGFVADTEAGRNHLRHLVERGAVPHAVEKVGHAECRGDQRIDQDPDGAEQGDDAERDRGVALLALDDAVGGDHRRGAADRAADAEQEPHLFGQPQAA